MKFYVVLISILFIELSLSAEEESNGKQHAIFETCKNELKVDDDVGKIVNERKVPQNENESCFHECVYEKLGVIQNNQFMLDSATRLFEKTTANDTEKLKKVHEVFKKCSDDFNSNQSADKCRLGKAFKECLIQNESEFDSIKN